MSVKVGDCRMPSYRVYFTVETTGISSDQVREALGTLASPVYGFELRPREGRFYVDVFNMADEEEAIEAATVAVDEFLIEAANKTGKRPPTVRVEALESMGQL